MAGGDGEGRTADAPRAVFVSYASQDAAIAATVVEALEHGGIACWIAPRDVTPGAFYADEIVHAIDATKAIVLILSRNAADSQHVLREVERAASKRHPVVSLRIDQTPLPAGLEYFLNTSQWLDASGGDIARAIPRLIAAVGVAVRTPAVTPEGVLPARSPLWSPPARSSMRTAVIGASLIGLAIAGSAIDRLWVSSRRAAHPSASTAPTAPAPPVPTVSEKSVAVLPFVDMSEKHDQEYFSDGLTEELIDRIAGAPGLKVIARTSSFEFKGKNEDIRSIARKLDVANLLEGSVRRSGQSLRVTAQLIRAADGTHLWSHSYDEHVANIFKVQEAIAEKVARELESVLESGPAARTETTNLQAYDAVQKGSYLWRRSETGDDDKALALFQEATRLDPGYALAWQKVAGVFFWKGYQGLLAVADARPQALSAIQRALGINPNLPKAHALLGSIYRDFDWNWRAAKEEFEMAARLDPNGGYGADAGYLNWILTGDISSEIASLRQDLARDPLDTGKLWGLGISYWAGQRYAESADTYLRLLELNPRFAGAPSLYAQALLFLGQRENALATALSDTDKSFQLGVLPCIYWKLGRTAESDTVLRELERDAAKRSSDVADMTACRGETDQVFVWLERAYRERQAGLQTVKFDPYLLSLHQDRRFQALLRKMNLSE